MNKTIFIHDTAVVSDSADVGDYTSIWHFSHVEHRAVIGENCNLGQNTYVGNNAVVGNACRLGNSVSVFSNVELEDFVFCAPFMVFTHISYPRAAVVRHNVFEKTIVKTGATIGANSTIVPGITIGVGSFIAAGSVLTKSTRNWSLMLGCPARHVGWVSAFGEKIPLPLFGSDKWFCGYTGDIYTLNGEDLIRQAGHTDILKYIPGSKIERVKL